MATIIAAMTNATVTSTMMRLISVPVSLRAGLVSPAVLRNRVSMLRYKA